jgi:cyclase
MLKSRIIPCLLLQNSGLVKTIKFSNSKYIGDPINAIKIFNDKEVDELIVLDISASKEKKSPDFAFIKNFASECFMPLSYGGGIQNVNQAMKLFELGVEKVSIQTAVMDSFRLIEDIAQKAGNQSIIVSVDIKKNWFGKYELYSSSKNKTIKYDWEQFIKDSVTAGAGEILINSVDKDGTMSGMDLSLISRASSLVNVPIVSAGGVGSLQDIKNSIESGSNAVAVGSYFVYYGPHRAVLISYPTSDELKELLK